MLAEINGVDIARPIDRETLDCINGAFLSHKVLVFRDQPLTPSLFVQFAKQFGPLQPHISKKCKHPDFEELIVVTNLDEDGEINPAEEARGNAWQTDMCYVETPAKATLLHTQQIPDVGGDIEFANMTLAFAKMPSHLKSRIEGQLATFRYSGITAHGREPLSTRDKNRPPVLHPAIRTHPETGKKSVFLNPAHTVSIKGLDREKAWSLMNEVFAWCSQSKFLETHQWRMNDTVIWDNRCCWYRATRKNPLRQPRIFLRTTVKGTPT